MSLLVLGGTAWLGREVASAARTLGQDVTVLARGISGAPPTGVEVVQADRGDPAAYDRVSDRDWDVVVDVSRQPSHVVSALGALAPRAASWVFVSSASVYAANEVVGADESAGLVPGLRGAGNTARGQPRGPDSRSQAQSPPGSGRGLAEPR